MATIFAEATSRSFKHKRGGRQSGRRSSLLYNERIAPKPLCGLPSPCRSSSLWVSSGNARCRQLDRGRLCSVAWPAVFCMSASSRRGGAACILLAASDDAAITEKLVPLMAALSLHGAAILVMNFTEIPTPWMISLWRLRNPAAATEASMASSIKQAVRYGVARGLFSTRGRHGLHAHARRGGQGCQSPCEQGYAAIISVSSIPSASSQHDCLRHLRHGAVDGHTSGIALTQ